METEDAPTVAEGRRSPGASSTGAGTGAGSGTGTGTSGRTTGATGVPSAASTLGLSDGIAGAASSTLDLPDPETVLRRSAYEQTKRTAMSGLLFNAVGLLCAPYMGGDPIAIRVFLGAMAIGVAYNAWLFRKCRTEKTYRQRYAVIYFSIAPFPNSAVVYYLGVFGPVLVMFVLNVYTACIAYNRRVARVVLIGAIAPVLVLGGLMTAGVLKDPGLIRTIEGTGAVGHGLIVGAFVVFLVLTYEQARKTRELMVASLVERDSAVRLASHREALVLEVRQDLDRALSAGGLGRFSDRTLGSFKLGAVLGRGAMGEVYDAKHVTTGEPAAVKMLLPEVLGRPAYVHRFLRETRIAASLDAPNVVKVLEVGDESAAMPYLAMERLSGEDLASMLRRDEPMTEEQVVDLVEQIGRGLTAAAAAGIVHRDLKPQNIFATDDDPTVWKILDFGVSKLAESGGGSLTRGEAIGTPRYMAPEQARGEDVDGRADLYSLGVIAYRALTGHPPFKGDDLPVLVEVLTRMPARPSSLAPTLHANVDAFFAIALAKKPEDRFQTARELVAALKAALAGKLDRSHRELAARLVGELPWRG